MKKVAKVAKVETLSAPQGATLSTAHGKGEGKRRRLLVVDDQVMLLDVIERQFADDPDLELVGVAKESGEAISMAESLRPDVIMLDIDLGGEESGFDVLRELRSRRTEEKVERVVMVSMFDNPMYRNRAFELGADAYATKGVRFGTIRALLLGDDAYKPPEGDRGKFWRNAPEAAAAGSVPSLVSLSDRERAVVREILSGAYEKEVAGRLGISVSSVNTFLRRAMDKLGVATRAELLRLRHPLRH